MLVTSIDASTNDLPWADTVAQYPTLVFYPAHRKRTSSLAYPHRLPLTVPNVFAFILANAGARLRWRLALALCDRQCRHAQIARAEAEIGGDSADLRVIADNVGAAIYRQQSLAKRDMFVQSPAFYFTQRAQLKQQLVVLRRFVDILTVLNEATIESEAHFERTLHDSLFLDWLLNQNALVSQPS